MSFTFETVCVIVLVKVSLVEYYDKEPMESKPANLIALKTSAQCLRDKIAQAERQTRWGSQDKEDKNMDKMRKKLQQLENQIVLALPGILLQVSY